ARRPRPSWASGRPAGRRRRRAGGRATPEPDLSERRAVIGFFYTPWARSLYLWVSRRPCARIRPERCGPSGAPALVRRRIARRRAGDLLVPRTRQRRENPQRGMVAGGPLRGG